MKSFFAFVALCASAMFANAQTADCNNISIDTDTFYLTYATDTFAVGNIVYNDTLASIYPFLHLVLSDTSIVTSPDVMVLSFLDSGQVQQFMFGIHFKTNAFANNTTVNGLFHVYDSDIAGDSTVSCYFLITLVLQLPLTIHQPLEPSLHVFPNPAVTTLHISGSNDQAITRIQVFRPDGRLVLNCHQPVSAELDVSNLPIGLYRIAINTARGVSYTTFIKL
jgi:hypothetical protein